MHTKIATCCYCGTRAALTLGGTPQRHELACAACGAPLHALKALPGRPAPADAPTRGPKGAQAGKKPKGPGPRRGASRGEPDRPAKPRRTGRPPRRRAGRLFGKLAREAFDLIEDICD